MYVSRTQYISLQARRLIQLLEGRVEKRASIPANKARRAMASKQTTAGPETAPGTHPFPNPIHGGTFP